MKIRDSFHPYAIITIICWALAYVYTKLALQCFSPLPLGFLCFFVASVTLVFVMMFIEIKPPAAKDILWFVISGATGFFLHMVLFNIGTGYVTAATTSIVIATVPIITALMAYFSYGESLKTYQWAAVAIEFAGILVLTLVGGSFSANKGVLWLLATALVLSIFNLIQRKLAKTYSSLQVSSYSIFIGTAMLAIFAPAAVNEVQQAPMAQLFYIGILGVLSSAIAYVAWAKALSKAEKISQVSNYMFVTPLVTGTLGFLIAGEVPGISTVVGGTIIILGLVLFNKESMAKQIMNYRHNHRSS